MANATTTTLAGAIPALVSDAVKRTFDVSLLLGTAKIKYMGQGMGKTMKFPTLPTSVTADASESSPFAGTAYTPGSGTATVVQNGYVLEISDFAADSSALTIEDMIGELMLANKEAQELRIANLFSTFIANPPTQNSTLTVAKVVEADGTLAMNVGNSVYYSGSGEGGLCLAISNAQYSALRGDIMTSKGSNFIGTTPLNNTANTGVINNLMGIDILASRQVTLSTGATADAVGLLYVRGQTIGAAIQREPYVTWQRVAVLPTGSIAGYIIAVSHAMGACVLRQAYGVQVQSDS